jgi:ubiquinone/menaquinone biosynthesis C-methylase UbiE
MQNPFILASQYKKYDAYEARTGLYRAGGRRLAEMLAKRWAARSPLASNTLMYDAGCGTGNSTLEALKVFPKSRIIGIDSSRSMLDYAKIKFGMADEKEMVRLALKENDMPFLLYLESFRRQASRFLGRLEFVESDFASFAGKEADAVIGAQFFHWLANQERGAEKFREVVRKGGYVAISSAGAFYKPKSYDFGRVHYLHHPVIRRYLETLAAKIEAAFGKRNALPSAENNLDPDKTIQLFKDNGFAVLEYKESPLPKVRTSVIFEYSLRLVPDHLRFFENTPAEENEKKAVIESSIRETLAAHAGRLPAMMQTDLLFMFLFRKK